jgi:hypothetical protein
MQPVPAISVRDRLLAIAGPPIPNKDNGLSRFFELFKKTPGYSCTFSIFV